MSSIKQNYYRTFQHCFHVYCLYIAFFYKKNNRHCLVDDIDFDRQKLIQKLNEYKHRIEQLERYLGGIKPTRKNTSIYINENSPYQSRRDLFETDIERSVQDEWMEKAKVLYKYIV